MQPYRNFFKPLLFLLIILINGCYKAEGNDTDQFAEARTKIANLSVEMENRKSTILKTYTGNRLNTLIQDFPIYYLNGDQKKLSDFKGKVVIVDMWATWCGPCKLISPYIADIKEKYKNDDLVVVGISYENEEKVFEYNQKHQYKYELAHSGMDAQRNLRVQSFPSIYVFDKSGKLQYYHMGVRIDTPKAIEWQVEYLLNQTATP